MNDRIIAVIGGGPAGLLSAIALHGLGYRLRIFERGAWPRDKACGEGIVPDGLAALRTLGIAAAELEAVGAPFQGIICHDMGRPNLCIGFAKGSSGLGIQRQDLSKVLWQHASALGIEVYPNSRLVGMETQRDNSWSLRVRSNGKDELINAAAVVAADGLHSTVCRLLPLRRQPLGAQRMGYRCYLTDVPSSGKARHVAIHWSRGSEIYLTPTRTGTSAALLVDRAMELDKLAPFVARTWPALGHLSSGERWAAHGPMGAMTIGPPPQGVFLVGDALCFADGITGEGISLAALGALWLKSAFKSKEMPDSRQLAADMLAATRAYRLITASALFLSKHPWLRAQVFAGLRLAPAALRQMFALQTLAFRRGYRTP